MSTPPDQRQAALLTELRSRESMTVVEAWQFGHEHGFYVGGEGPEAKRDLMALCQRNQARRHDGFWRHIGEPDRIRLRFKRWADYWTAARP
jgi:hypothetical protein